MGFGGQVGRKGKNTCHKIQVKAKSDFLKSSSFNFARTKF